jgi:hypothetical protein
MVLSGKFAVRLGDQLEQVTVGILGASMAAMALSILATMK